MMSHYNHRIGSSQPPHLLRVSWPHLMTRNSHVWAYWSRAAFQSSEPGSDIVTRLSALMFPSHVISVNTSDNTCQHVRIESSLAELHWTWSSRQGFQVLMLTSSHFVHAFSNLHAHFRPCQHHGAYLSIKTSPWMCLDACLLSSVCFLRVCWDFMTNLFGNSRNQFVSLCLCFAKLESCCKN